jgi:tetratricopeptide (TPR) repeat protein
MRPDKTGSILRFTIFAGLLIFILAIAVLLVFYLIERSATKITRQQANFARTLREYDLLFREIAGTERDFVILNRDLERLEKMAIGVESWLSVLKRRRTLAQIHPPSRENYINSINNALETFPASQPITALAAEALIKNTAINKEAEEKLRNWLAHFNDPVFNSLRLGLHVLLGDFRNPQRAAVIPSSLLTDGTEAITIDLAILKIIRDDIRGAAADIQTMLYSPNPTVDSLRLAAEFFYDFGDLERSAETFSLIGDEKARIREADALYLAGYKDSARSIWYMLSEQDTPNVRSLYNLGVTTEDKNDAAAYFEKLMNIELPADIDSLQFGLIHYSRLLDYEQAIEILEKTESFNPKLYPYIDLELSKRHAPWWLLERQIAEAWLLLDRHDNNEDMYRWAVWLLLFQRNYSEIQILLNRIENMVFEYPYPQWANSYRAIQQMFTGNIEKAQEILLAIPVEEAEWNIHANLGRIYESQRSPSRALEQYELATEKVQNPKSEARIQIRIAKCFSALSFPNEAIRALLYAQELDPDNLNARLELDRLLY